MKIHFPDLDFWFSISKALSGYGTPVIFFSSLGITRLSNLHMNLHMSLSDIMNIKLVYKESLFTDTKTFFFK